MRVKPVYTTRVSAVTWVSGTDVGVAVDIIDQIRLLECVRGAHGMVVNHWRSHCIPCSVCRYPILDTTKVVSRGDPLSGDLAWRPHAPRACRARATTRLYPRRPQRRLRARGCHRGLDTTFVVSRPRSSHTLHASAWDCQRLQPTPWAIERRLIHRIWSMISIASPTPF